MKTIANELNDLAEKMTGINPHARTDAQAVDFIERNYNGGSVPSNVITTDNIGDYAVTPSNVGDYAITTDNANDKGIVADWNIDYKITMPIMFTEQVVTNEEKVITGESNIGTLQGVRNYFNWVLSKGTGGGYGNSYFQKPIILTYKVDDGQYGLVYRTLYATQIDGYSPTGQQVYFEKIVFKGDDKVEIRYDMEDEAFYISIHNS